MASSNPDSCHDGTDCTTDLNSAAVSAVSSSEATSTDDSGVDGVEPSSKSSGHNENTATSSSQTEQSQPNPVGDISCKIADMKMKQTTDSSVQAGVVTMSAQHMLQPRPHAPVAKLLNEQPQNNNSHNNSGQTNDKDSNDRSNNDLSEKSSEINNSKITGTSSKIPNLLHSGRFPPHPHSPTRLVNNNKNNNHCKNAMNIASPSPSYAMSPSLSNFPAAPPTTPYSPYNHLNHDSDQHAGSSGAHGFVNFPTLPSKYSPSGSFKPPFHFHLSQQQQTSFHPSLPLADSSTAKLPLSISPPLSPSTHSQLYNHTMNANNDISKEIPTTMTSPSSPSSSLNNNNPPHPFANDPHFQSLLSQTLSTTLQNEQSRIQALTTHENTHYTTLSEYQHALARERRHSTTLAMELAHYQLLSKYTSCFVHNSMEISEEAKINNLMKQFSHHAKEMKEEKGRVVMELEREEERMVNSLMGRLEGVRREKEMLEGELRRMGQLGGVGSGGVGSGIATIANLPTAGSVIHGGGVGRSAYGTGAGGAAGRGGVGSSSHNVDEQRLHAQFEQMMREEVQRQNRIDRQNEIRQQQHQQHEGGQQDEPPSHIDHAALVETTTSSNSLQPDNTSKGDKKCNNIEDSNRNSYESENDDSLLDKMDKKLEAEGEQKEEVKPFQTESDYFEEEEEDDDDEEDDEDQDILEGMHHDPEMEAELEKLMQKKSAE